MDCVVKKYGRALGVDYASFRFLVRLLKNPSIRFVVAGRFHTDVYRYSGGETTTATVRETSMVHDLLFDGTLIQGDQHYVELESGARQRGHILVISPQLMSLLDGNRRETGCDCVYCAALNRE